MADNSVYPKVNATLFSAIHSAWDRLCLLRWKRTWDGKKGKLTDSSGDLNDANIQLALKQAERRRPAETDSDFGRRFSLTRKGVEPSSG